MSVAKLATIWLIILCALLGRVENQSIFGIGARINGDQLLVKDVLQAPSTHTPEIRFNYAIPDPITCIEIHSEENIFADVHFSYTNDLVHGTVTTLNNTARSGDGPLPTKRLQVVINVYGFKTEKPNLNALYILNRDTEPMPNDEPVTEQTHENQSDSYEYETNSEAEELGIEFSNVTNADDGDDEDDDDDDDDDNNDDDFDDDDHPIVLGHRQKGDYKIFECFQTSLTSSHEPTNHSVTFYYVDNNFITYAKFVIYDHNASASPNDQNNQNTAFAEYSLISEHTLKAVITDYNTKSLFVQMYLYGYRPEDVPLGRYIPFMISTGHDDALHSTVSPMTSLRLIKMMMNAQSRGTAQTTTEDNDDNNDEDNDGDDDDDDDDTNNEPKTNEKLPPCNNAAVSMSSNSWMLPAGRSFIGWFKLAAAIVCGAYVANRNWH